MLVLYYKSILAWAKTISVYIHQANSTAEHYTRNHNIHYCDFLCYVHILWLQ